MAKQKTEPAAEPAPVATPASGVRLVLRKDCQVGDRPRKCGDVLCTVMLEPGVNLAHLMKFYQDGMVGDAEKGARPLVLVSRRDTTGLASRPVKEGERVASVHLEDCVTFAFVSRAYQDLLVACES